MTYLTEEPISIEAWHRKHLDARDGASVEFLGVVREEEQGKKISFLDYEAYPPMAEKMIAALIEEAKVRWPLHHVYLRHRMGRVRVGEVSVLIGVQAPHRDEAFAACRFLIDTLKKNVPIWKRNHANRTDVSEKRCVTERS